MGLDRHTALSVNLNKVALIRNTRHLSIPSVTQAAQWCLQAGAQGITVHPRPDGRHIRLQDVHQLAELLTQWPGRELNIEGNPFHNLMDIARAIKPQQCTFVPDEQGQFTSDHGWNLTENASRLRPLIAELSALGVRVSLFMDAEPDSMQAAKESGADRVELYTEPYAAAFGSDLEGYQLKRFESTARLARKLGLEVNAGHDLNRTNLTKFLQHVPGVKEVSIGHALISDALESGYSQTVQAYLHCIELAEA